MNILALNPGSGTLRYKLLAMPRAGGREDGEEVVTDGNIDHVHGGATVQAAERAVDECLPLGLDAIGYRVVHGGSRFDGPACCQVVLWSDSSGAVLIVSDPRGKAQQGTVGAVIGVLTGNRFTALPRAPLTSQIAW